MNSYRAVNLIVLGLIACFLLTFFPPQYLFSLTSTTGGDTGSHFPTLVFLKEALLSRGQIMFWEMGNYAGFPMFYHYFPATYIFMVVMSFIVPIQVAFKLGTVLGTFLLPLCVFLAFRYLRYPFPVPITGACLSLGFLFIESNSMWGGNIPSTLAGEYSYSFSLAVFILFFGSLYDGITNRRGVIRNALLVFLMGFSHGFTIVLSGFLGLFFLFDRKEFKTNLVYLFKIFSLGTLLLSFWFLPFLGNVHYVTEYVTKWYINSLAEVLPRNLWPFLALSVFALFLNFFDRRTRYFLHAVAASLFLYFFATRLGMLDIRFIPFVQLFAAIFGATVLLPFLSEIKSKDLVPLIVFLIVALWTAGNTTFIKSWVKWNYEGVEGKASYPLYKQINDYLHTAEPKGRVVYEHSPKHNTFGTERAFENLPYFAKRETLEGLYMQSSISSPFIFYIQSEVSKLHSGPFPQYRYSYLNQTAALPHLTLFNVTHYIVRSEQAKEEIKSVPGYRLEKEFGEYQIYRVVPSDGHYVTIPKFRPIEFHTPDWKKDSFEWFRRHELLEVPLVFVRDDLQRTDLNNLPRIPVQVSNVRITETKGPDWLKFTTNQVGKPHIIKISYHPNWRVTGADKIYLVSPSFMLVYPTSGEVRLHFGKSGLNDLGLILSLIGLSILLGSVIISRRDG